MPLFDGGFGAGSTVGPYLIHGHDIALPGPAGVVMFTPAR
jgi:hypothetical protein